MEGDRGKNKTCPHIFPKWHWPLSCQSLGYVKSRGEHTRDVCRCFWAQLYVSAMAEGWLCSSSVGLGYAISVIRLWQNFLKTEKGRGVFKMSKEGRGQGHRHEQSLKDVCGEISVHQSRGWVGRVSTCRWTSIELACHLSYSWSIRSQQGILHGVKLTYLCKDALRCVRWWFVLWLFTTR